MGQVFRAPAGTLLASWPDMLDPNFMHSVVLVCRHEASGAYGLVTNRPTGLTVGELFPEHHLLAGSTFPVHLGGPVDHSTVQFLHRAPDAIPGGLDIDGEVFLGGELEAMARYLVSAPADLGERLRVFLGYSGWGEGQLEAELSTGSWIPVPANREAVFGATGEAAWRRVVRSIGDAGAELENHPPDVSWN